MCTVIRRDQVEHSIIADKPFKVYKYGKPNAVKDFVSAIQQFRYCTGVEYNFWMTYADDGSVSDEIEANYIQEIPRADRVFVVEGAHAFISLKRLKQPSNWKYLSEHNGYKIAQFTIPKNARYYINGAGNIVSSAIKFNKFI